jgi:hypothetical protein
MALEQVELEFAQQLHMLQQMTQAPEMVQNPEVQKTVQQLQVQIESRKSILIAEMMDEFMKEEKKISSQFDNDPLAKLKARELDLMAQNNERKSREAQDRLNLDKMKAMMNQSATQEKLQQNEDLAELRAATSLVKQQQTNINKKVQ